MPSTDQALAMAAIPNHGLALCEAICAGNEADMPYRNFLKFIVPACQAGKSVVFAASVRHDPAWESTQRSSHTD